MYNHTNLFPHSIIFVIWTLWDKNTVSSSILSWFTNVLELPYAHKTMLFKWQAKNNLSIGVLLVLLGEYQV